MAKKTDLAAAKARKQKFFLIGAGVVLLGLAAIQGPKLMKHGSSPSSAPEATAASDTADGGTVVAAAAAVPAASTPSFAAAAYVAGVALPGTPAGTSTTGQLASFTLFDDKDPFVQQVGDDTEASGADGAAPADAASDSSEAPASGSGTQAPAEKPDPIVFATIKLDGQPQQLELKKNAKFPKPTPLFVLVSLKKGVAKVGVAGGSFDNGETVTLKLGKKVTLVDTATGVDYELKLTYTGSQAQVLESFSSADQPAAATADGAPAAPTATPTATPTPAP